ncbi:MAG: nicotinate (nicotinamide) nucleotide adenylyltransferase [Clostridia bacterium]|nr:nicotinate (nicotinamide) nucleotide adenylyltransferase [Clostridia bacterium]
MKKLRKIAVYGGSFNPIHNAHIAIIQAFVKKFKPDKLLLIPTNIPPHKSAENMATGSERAEMCRLALKDMKKVEVCDIELKREGKSYTVDTLRELSEMYPDSEFYLIMGEDMFVSLLDWRRPEEIFKLAVICTVARGGGDLTQLYEMDEKYKALGAQTVILDMKKSDVSSTMIRQAVFNDKSISKYVCEDVERYIYAHYLYMNKAEINYPRFHKVLKSRMGEKRYIHSCNVALEAVRLAELHGADKEKAKLAGLLHDVTKETPHDEQLALMRRLDVPLDELTLLCPKLWHAISGAAFVRHIIGIEDDDIFNAIRYHTSGRAGMSVLEKCIFIADFTSAERNYNGVAKMRELADKSLDSAILFGVSFSIADLAGKNSAIDPNAIACYNEVVLNKMKESN